MSTVSESSAVTTWRKITSVPDGLSDHYQYGMEYKEGKSSWLEWSRLNHDPSPDQHENDTLTDLTSDMVYSVRVKSYRVKQANREETGCTEHKSFKTKCMGMWLISLIKLETIGQQPGCRADPRGRISKTGLIVTQLIYSSSNLLMIWRII